jgi:hypothetical protein
MKTIKLTTDEQVMLLSALKIANLFERSFLRDKEVLRKVKSRIRLFRKVVQLSDLRGDIYQTHEN